MICIPMKNNYISNIIFSWKKKKNRFALGEILFAKWNILAESKYFGWSEIVWLLIIFCLHFWPHTRGWALDGAVDDASPLVSRCYSTQMASRSWAILSSPWCVKTRSRPLTALFVLGVSGGLGWLVSSIATASGPQVALSVVWNPGCRSDSRGSEDSERLCR